MKPVIPITIRGDNLGQRHHNLNLQVNQLVSDHVTFEDIEALPEQTPLDRIFKIDIANKLKNIDYILNTLKDDDMLYVSRALKCKWLLERRDVINPKHLEETLFPQMVMPAINKMKHWLYINLYDSISCQEFYRYYKHVKFNFAIKFLIKCDNEFVLKEFPDLLTKLTPHYLKIFGEKNPKLIKIYFDTLATNPELVKQYLENEESFYKSTKCVLKTDPGVFFDIVEKYHNLNGFSKLSPSASDYILRFHKNRFMAKSELYVVHLLHIPTVAKLLSVEECKEIVIRLARSVYLSWWFTYSNVEPLVKRIDKETRSAFKKQVFVEKNIGENIVDCPYEFPRSPVTNETDCDEPHIFIDREYDPLSMNKNYQFFRYAPKSCCMAYGMCNDYECYVKKSELQKLFDEFRFMGFESTLQELKDRVSATSSADRRRDMLLVLVSKTGGRVESLRIFLEFALRLRNEPVHVRAAIVRSLVKRACVWRLPDDVWNTMLEYGVGLGLDGTKAEAECREGLHAVVLRQLLASGECDSLVRTAFLDNFSTLSTYKLTVTERAVVGNSLQNMLITASKNANLEDTANYLSHLLGVLNDYKINMEKSPVVSAIAELANRDQNLARPLLEHLYKAKVGRRQLLRQYLQIRHDDAAFVNVLRHDPEVLDYSWFIKLLIDGKTRPNQFLLKLAVYYKETGGVAEKIRIALQNKIIQDFEVRLARPLAMLTGGENLQSILCSEDIVDKKRYKLSAALRANMHLSRPAVNALALGWRKAGLKAVAVRAMRCRPAEVNQIIQMLLNDGSKRSVRLALSLTNHTNCDTDIFAKAVTIRPLAALRAALLYFRRQGDAADLQVWDIIKPFIMDVDLKNRQGLCYILRKVEWVPKTIKPNYCAILYLVLDKISNKYAVSILQDLMKNLHEISEDLLDKVLLHTLENISKEDPISYPAIVMRYLMLSKNIPEENTRFDVIGAPFLEKVFTFRDDKDESRRNFFIDNLNQIRDSLQYNYAFFDAKYNNCITVIEKVLKWIETFLPKDTYFKWYVHIHATMLYYKAIKHSIKQNPEVFENETRKMSEGVNIVGFVFGRYIALEVAELQSKYFESVVELYGNAFTEYLDGCLQYGKCKTKFTAAIIKGILNENIGCETLLGVHVLKENRYNFGEEKVFEEMKNLFKNKKDLMGQYFYNAYILE